MANIRLVVPQNKSAGFDMVPIEDIPDELAAEVEEAYEALKDRENARLRAEFGSKAELDEWVTLVRSYCLQRPDGELYFRRSPTPNLPENVCDFKILSEAPKVAKASKVHVDRSIPLK